MSVVIERGLSVSLPSAAQHLVTGREVATLPCGCAVWVGRRTDDGQAATVAEPCSTAHRMTVAVRFNEAMAATLPSKSQEPLIDVVARILMDAA